MPAAAVTGTALVILTGAVLALTVAPTPPHAPIPGTSPDDPPPAYATALGGSSALLIDAYRVATAMPDFVGPASYRGEQLLMWVPFSDVVRFPNPEFAGMYHSLFNTLPSNLPDFTAGDAMRIRSRRPGEILLWDATAAPFPAALRALAPFRPSLLRSATLRSGPVVLHLWLIRLGTYFDPAAGR